MPDNPNFFQECARTINEETIDEVTAVAPFGEKLIIKSGFGEKDRQMAVKDSDKAALLTDFLFACKKSGIEEFSENL